MKIGKQMSFISSCAASYVDKDEKGLFCELCCSFCFDKDDHLPTREKEDTSVFVVLYLKKRIPFQILYCSFSARLEF